MEYAKGKIAKLLIDYFGSDFRRITHALEVLRHAETIAERTGGCDSEVLVASALLHDIGIRRSEEELGFNNGPTQEKYGPPEAERLLRGIGFPEEKTKKVRDIIGNHHSRPRFDYPELAVLREADAIVNRNEGG
jgi:putative nucleotidyltransferase with HDIG domain